MRIWAQSMQPCTVPVPPFANAPPGSTFTLRMTPASRCGAPRAQVEQAVEQVIQHAGRALGATPFCCSSHFARLSADLPVYIRQSHAERDLAELGRQLTGLPAGAWQL
jgi:hypothetical protein